MKMQPTIRLQLRTNVEVNMTGLPIDLTAKEASRIKALIEVFAMRELKIIENKSDGLFAWERSG